MTKATGPLKRLVLGCFFGKNNVSVSPTGIVAMV